ncbi:MAG: proton-conducting transporter membrane subunit [Candidatus Edwardsbacteria bacterium]
MNPNILLIPILLPAVIGGICLLIPSKIKWPKEWLAILTSLILLVLAGKLFALKELRLLIPWTSFGIDFDLRLYYFSKFILLAAAGFVVLLSIYSVSKMSNWRRLPEYYSYFLLTAAFTNGAILANNFVVLLFFWEALLITLYGLITIGGSESWRTALKSFVIVGVSDFLMILGIIILWNITGTLTMSEIHIPTTGLAAVAFVLMAIGALAKAGAMPFHQWIPDAAIDAPVTVMAYLPASLEKLLGIYLLARISLDFFIIKTNDLFSIILMTVGAVTIVFAVLMALIQKDFKKLLSFHAISQVGYMVLGVGTGIPIGIAGGIFHMLNHAMYKCCLFLSGGSVEYRAGTTELKKLGGLGREMPITFFCFSVAALSISGVWPFNGFVSKEMVFHGSYETGYIIFPIAAWIGAIFTFASFLKLGHSTFLGPRTKDIPKVKESSVSLLIPMLALAFGCILFGLYSKLPLKFLIEPILGEHPEIVHEHHLEFWREGLNLINPIAGISVLCLVIALLIHTYGWKKQEEKAHLASEVIHNLPVLHWIYERAEERVFDLYHQGMKLARGFSQVVFVAIDRAIDWIYEKAIVQTGRVFTEGLRGVHTGYYSTYLSWCIAGLVAIVAILGWVLK